MDNETNPSTPQGEEWLEDFFSAPPPEEEIGPDEQAVAAAGLTNPEDAEVEKVIQETLSEDWGGQTRSWKMPEEAFRDEEYRDTFGEEDSLAAMFREEDAAKEAEVPEDALPVLETEPAPEPKKAKKAGPPPKKGRPRRKKGYGLLGIPHILATAVWLAIVIVIGSSLGRIVWLCASDVLALGRESQKVTFTVTDTDNIDTIASKLKNAGLIRYPTLFKYYADLTHAEEDISTGTFTLNTVYDYHALVSHMRYYSPGRQEVEIMFPEGATCAQIFSKLEEEGVCTVEKLEAYAANGDLSDDYWFLEGVQRGDRYCLEGYLFPNTYKFYTNDDPKRVLEKFLDSFDDNFTDRMRENFITLNQRTSEMMRENGYGEEYIASHQFTIQDVVIIASMIERESSGEDESYTVSSVLYNRLTDPDFDYLQVDATIVYALGGKTDPLTAEDLQVDSPYNTYTHAGLTPGPISNPGQHSLAAALDPDDTDYYYYARNPNSESRKHSFFKTLKEFQAFLDTF